MLLSSDSATPREAALAYVRTQLELTVSFHMPQSMGKASLTQDAVARMREHVVLIEDVLRRIVDDGIVSGDFDADLDVDATVPIINSLLVGSAARRFSRPALEQFVLRGLGATV